MANTTRPRKRNPQINPQNPPNSQTLIDQQNQLKDAAMRMDEIARMEEQTKIMKQESMNKSHDTEFTQYSDVNANGNTMGAMDVIGVSEIKKAMSTLMDYKNEKATLVAKIGENEEFWRLNHWNTMADTGVNANKRIKPKSAWLFNVIINKHADAMDNFPEPNILPRSKDDEETAKILSKIIPVILEQNDYEKTYSDCQWYKSKQGSSVQGVFWNNDKENGLGDVEIKKIDMLNLFWKGGIKDIQDSPNVFHVAMVPLDDLKEMYPDLTLGNTGNHEGLTTENIYDNTADTSKMTAVIDWYYKKRVKTVDNLGIPKTKTVLHYCKFCNSQVIYASENDPNYAEKGWYDHGLYPFVFDTLFPIEGEITGLSYIDIEKDDQLYIDKLQQAILESAIANARPRYFVRGDGSVNKDQFSDLSEMMVECEGNLGENDIRRIENSDFNSAYISVYLNKVQEIKDTSGNTASSQGQTSSVTSASGIASLQEAAGKLSRDANNASYRAYRNVVNLVIELIRQFYNEPRCFRIAGETNKNEFVSFDNSGLLPQSQGSAMGIDLGSRLPIMDIEVKPQKRSAYSKESQNQTALQLYSMGFFAPTNADAALACLNMMEFDQIDPVKEQIEKNGTLMQLVMQMQQQLVAYQQQLMQLGVIVDNTQGTNIAQSVAEEAQGTAEATQRAAQSGTTKGSGSMQVSKGSLSSQAANATRGSTAPR